MTKQDPDLLCDPVLIDCGIEHGFGQRGSQPPDSTVFPQQVHGVEVFDCRSAEAVGKRPEADVIVTAKPGICVGIVTADCLPIFLAAFDGNVVAAVHAGWRGLAAGVIETGIHALRSRMTEATLLVAAVGPAAGRCCYEVDQPVRDALALRYEGQLEHVLSQGRPGHFQLDLPGLASAILIQNGVEKHHIGLQNSVCTLCSSRRFESYRRDGPAAGRMKHFIATARTRAVPDRVRVDSPESGP